MEKRVWGEFKGEDVVLYTLRSGDYKLSLMTKGATIVYYGTEDYNGVLSHPSFNDFLLPGNGHRGEIVGPVANRISNAAFSIGGERYNLEKNFHSRHTLHSASANWGDKNWLVTKEKENQIEFYLNTPDGDGGFPGNHEVYVTYTLLPDGELSIFYRVSSDKECPVAPTNHVYFVLDDRDSRYVKVKIPAKEYIEVDPEDLIPLPDTPTPVAGTDYDFNTSMEIGKRRDGMYDNTWLLDKEGIIEAEGNSASLYVKTTEIGVQMYTAATLPVPFEGVAFETGRCPDTPNRPDFSSFNTDRNREYSSHTIYKLMVKEEK